MRVVGRCSPHAKEHSSKYSCASLITLDMKWACICAGKKNVLGVVWCDVSVLCVFVRVAMRCSVLSLWSSLCCWLRQCGRRCVGCCVVKKRVQKK